MPNIAAYSTITQLGSYEVTKGVTGNTGPTGPTGFQGPGLTGNTGPAVAGITLIDRFIFTTFSNGNGFTTPNVAIGKTGSYNYLVDFLNSGSGASLAHSITGSELSLRPIRISTTEQNKILITTESDKITVNVAPKTISGLTLNSMVSTDLNSFLLEFSSGSTKFRRTQIKPQEYSSAGVAIPMANLFERVRGMGWTGSTAAVNCISTVRGTTCSVNPFVYENDEHMFNTRSKIFVGDFEGTTASIIIPPCPTTNEVHAFDMYISNAKNPANLVDRFISSSPIRWPGNRTPCFTTTVSGAQVAQFNPGPCNLRITFFGIDGIWYGTSRLLTTTCSNTVVNGGLSVPLMLLPNCSHNTDVNNLAPPNTGGNGERGIDEQDIQQFISLSPLYTYSPNSTILGACCRADGTCEITNPYLCEGYFHGYGTTCGATFNSICNKFGACCINSGYGNSIYHCEELSCTQCLGISGAVYAGNQTACSGVSCSIVIQKIGACCDGLGGCEQVTEYECLAKQGFYQGDQSSCFAGGVAVCSSGTGPCCINGNCTSTSSTECFNSNGYFLGLGRDCGEFTCPKAVSCLGYINGVPLLPGQHYGGGIVIGKFEPGISDVLGAKQLFDPASINIVPGVTTYTSQLYKSFLDHSAYGITKDCGFNNESYIMIIYHKDLEIDGNDVFAWGGTGSSWGPILDSGGNFNDFVLKSSPDDITSSPVRYLDTHLAYTEGFWSRGTTAIDSGLIQNSFQTCNSSTTYGRGGVERVFTKPQYSLHGYWHSSWGLYNTIRAIHAHNTYKKKVTVSPVFNWREYATYSEPNAFDSIRLLNDGITSESQGITANSSALSGWYLPSHDEMAFIAANTVNSFGFNINQSLMLTPEGRPLNGTYWTSTGTFDYSKNEGIYNGSTKPTPGSVAVSMKFDINGSDFKVIKTDRQNKLKVRPVRMIRCDAQTPKNRYLWFIPSVLNDANKNTNQRNIDILDIGAI